MSSLNDFKLEKILGKGAFSVVLLVHRILDGQTYAMKQVRINQKGLFTFMSYICS